MAAVSSPRTFSTSWLKHIYNIPTSTDHGAWTIGSGTSENQQRVCSQLKLQQANGAPPTTQRKSKIDTNARWRHIPEEYLCSNTRHCHAPCCRVHTFLRHGGLFFVRFPKQFFSSIVREFEYIHKFSHRKLMLRDISNTSFINMDHIFNCSQETLGTTC